MYTTSASSLLSASYSRGLVIILVSVNASVKSLIRSPFESILQVGGFFSDGDPLHLLAFFLLMMLVVP